MGIQFPSLNSRGQGMVEYILVVVVVITMAIIIGYRLFKPFNQWANHYIGSYVECLLDYGELPRLGGEEASNMQDGECDKEFKPFTVGEGREKKEDAEKAKANSNANRGGGNNRGGGGNSLANARGRNRAPIGAGFDKGAGERSGVIQVKTGNEGLSGGRNASSGFNVGTRPNRSTAQEIQYRGFAGMIEREKEKIKKREEKIRTVGKTDGGSDGSSGKKNAFEVKPREKKHNDEGFGENDWSLGNLVRTVLIIMIVIALALFLAGQLAQISKSMEKN